MQKADLLTILINFSSLVDPILTLLVVISTIVGVLMVGQALMNAYVLSMDNGAQWGSTATIPGIISGLIIGGILVTPILMVQIFGNTLFMVSVNGSGMLYQGVGMTDTQKQAVAALFGLFSVAGFIAFIRGWVVLNKHFNGVIKDGVGMGITFIVGGTGLIYLDVIVDLIQSKTGFDFTQVFLF